MAAPRGVIDIDVTGSPALPVGGPPSVPSRMSVVLVEEANSGDTPRLGCPCEFSDIRLLGGGQPTMGVDASTPVPRPNHRFRPRNGVRPRQFGSCLTPIPDTLPPPLPTPRTQPGHDLVSQQQADQLANPLAILHSCKVRSTH